MNLPGCGLKPQESDPKPINPKLWQELFTFVSTPAAFDSKCLVWFTSQLMKFKRVLNYICESG